MVEKNVKKKSKKTNVSQNVKVYVKVGGETKKRRRKRVAKKKVSKGVSNAPSFPSTTLYGVPPIPSQIPPVFDEQKRQQGLLEQSKQSLQAEGMKLLEDIKKQTSEQIIKAQSAEQKGELAQRGWISPVPKEPTISQEIQTMAPSFTEIMNKSKEPQIEDITPSNLISNVPKPKLILEEEEEGFTYRIPLAPPPPVKRYLKKPKPSELNIGDIFEYPSTSLEGQYVLGEVIEQEGKKMVSKKISKIPQRNIETENITQTKAKEFNLV